MAFNLLGKDFTPPDVVAKVTGKAKYAEDFRAEGMAFCKLYLSRMPHAKVHQIDASRALAMEGVLGVLTADDLPPIEAPGNAMLTNEPVWMGQPILAVAAVDEKTAVDAVENVYVDLEMLPFVIDPLDSLHPGGPMARAEGNVANPGLDFQTIRWTARDFAAVDEGQLPQGKAAEEWSYGDIEAGFAEAKLVLDETFLTAGYAHHCMETRSAMAYWRNGKLYLHGSIQSSAFALPGLARYCGVRPSDMVFISEYCGGGFGSKGGAYPFMAIPAHMSKKIGRPVMMRITRAEEYYIGSGRAGFQGRIKIGFRADGRVTAVDAFVVQDNGPNTGFADFRNFGGAISMVLQPLSMRWRGIPVLTNTPARGPQRGPGENQTSCAIEPIISKAARELGLDQVAIRRINAPDKDAKVGAKRTPVTSAHLKEALDKGAQLFDWEEKKKTSGQRNGGKVIGVGVGQGYHVAGVQGFDGLMRITPDGVLHVHSGVGNLGTYSYAGTSRVAAEVLGYDWKNVVIVHGDSSKHLPWTIGQFGSLTTYTITRAVYMAAEDARKKLLEIAATDMGGGPDDYVLRNETVVAKADPSKSMTFAKAAQRAIELGGKFSGHELPEDINGMMTRPSAAALAGSGLIGVSKDTLPKNGLTPGLVASFVQIELDTETGKLEILDFAAVADCGTVLHPASFDTQMRGASIMGFGMACMERHVFDPVLGSPANRGLLQCRPPTALDVPADMKIAAVGIADPSNPVGSKGMGEPPMGAAASALVNAISDALGGHNFYRTPITPDDIILAAAGRPQSHWPLWASGQ